MTLSERLLKFFQDDQFDHCNDAMWGDMEEEVLPGVFTKLIDRYGGENKGSDFWAVWQFTSGDEQCFLKFEGWYASFVGAEFERVFEVHPKVVEVTQYV